MKGNLLTEAEINAIKHDFAEDLRFNQITNESSLLLMYQEMEIKWKGKNRWTNNELGVHVSEEYSIYVCVCLCVYMHVCVCVCIYAVYTHTLVQKINSLYFVCLEIFFCLLFCWKAVPLVKFLKFKSYLNIPYLLIYSAI